MNKQTIIKAVRKMQENKQLIKEFDKGRVSKQIIKQKGISLEKPL